MRGFIWNFFNDFSFWSDHLNLEIKFYQDHYILTYFLYQRYLCKTLHFLNQMPVWKQKIFGLVSDKSFQETYFAFLDMKGRGKDVKGRGKLD